MAPPFRFSGRRLLGTVLVKDIVPGPQGSGPLSLQRPLRVMVPFPPWCWSVEPPARSRRRRSSAVELRRSWSVRRLPVLGAGSTWASRTAAATAAASGDSRWPRSQRRGPTLRRHRTDDGGGLPV